MKSIFRMHVLENLSLDTTDGLLMFLCSSGKPARHNTDNHHRNISFKVCLALQEDPASTIGVSFIVKAAPLARAFGSKTQVVCVSHSFSLELPFAIYGRREGQRTRTIWRALPILE